MKIISHLAVSLVALMTVGCCPVRFTRSPGVSGVVLDSVSGAPVAGAKAAMYHHGSDVPDTINASNIFTIDARRVGAIADKSGRFTVPPLREWATWNPFWFPLADMKEGGGTLIVYQEGYEPAYDEVQTQRKSFTMGHPIMLRPIAK
jgi:hypothetical protein